MQTHVYYIDLKSITTKEAFHQTLKDNLPLPDDYGNNLDALYDVLTEQGEGWNLIFYNTTGMEEQIPDYLTKLKKLSRQAQSETDNLQIRFYP